MHYAVFCGRFIITINWDYLYTQKQGKLASICLKRFSSIFETSVDFLFVYVDALCHSRIIF